MFVKCHGIFAFFRPVSPFWPEKAARPQPDGGTYRQRALPRCFSRCAQKKKNPRLPGVVLSLFASYRSLELQVSPLKIRSSTSLLRNIAFIIHSRLLSLIVDLIIPDRAEKRKARFGVLYEVCVNFL
ncbi:hypothetical protein [uncultured Oscillibacter sp.]|uniref:hypothetical protein n=1 Tax=uncultured Oscillibacter sp. TaxID=876091 RepID=UPI0025EDB2E0|nr:hypothetical protein [uncultured Oscillibacter sp.]